MSSVHTPPSPASRHAVPPCRGSESATAGIRVQVRPAYIADQSDPTARQWLFSYRITISNEGPEPVKLLTRTWRIVDGSGNTEDVHGPGVVGKQPRLAAGQSFEYSSYCQIRTNWGTMEGCYDFQTDDGRTIRARIERFYLVGPEAPRR